MPINKLEHNEMIKAICFVICGECWGPALCAVHCSITMTVLSAAETESGEPNVLVSMQVCWLYGRLRGHQA